MYYSVNDSPECIKVNTTNDITDIQAYSERRAGTPYSGGVFRVERALGKDLVQTTQKDFFSLSGTKTLNPNVANNC
jgi:hypothetical protein